MPIQQMLLGSGGKLIPAGQQLWEGGSVQSANWNVPADVTEISAVAIGGGGNGSQGYVSTYTHGGTGGNGGNLVYSNGISVTPGETLSIVIAPVTSQQSGSSAADGNSGGVSGIKRGSTWLLKAMGGAGGSRTRINATWNVWNNNSTGQSHNVGDTLNLGGLGGSRRAPTVNENFCGGGGAAGYSGGGGSGGVYVGGNIASAVSSGAGTGGGGSGGVPIDNGAGAGGGGVGLFGEGSSGAAVNIINPSTGSYWDVAVRGNTVGNAGSGGVNGSSTPSNGNDGGAGGTCGGGAGGQKNMNRSNWGQGGFGGVRIIHGTGRAYPSTRTANE